MDPTARDNGASRVTARIQEVLSRLMNYTNTFIAVAPDISQCRLHAIGVRRQEVYRCT